MGRPAHYRTRQSEAILGRIASLGGTQFTAGQIGAYFEHCGTPVALTTIYRHLEKLTQEGVLRRYAIDGVPGACYRYTGEAGGVKEQFCLRCEGCGDLVPLDCGEIQAFRQHIADEHAFRISPMKTVLYGKCKTCFEEG